MNIATGAKGFTLLTTLSTADSNPDLLLGLFSTFDNFTSSLLNQAPDVAIEIVDHTGAALSYGRSCSMPDAVITRSHSIEVTTTASWTLRVGACAAYQNSYTTSKRWLFVGVVSFTTLVIAELYRRMALKRLADEQMAVKEHADQLQQQTHNVIVGYVCHEVRNPLHVFKSAYACMRECLMEYRDMHGPLATRVWSDDVLTLEDGAQAVLQMQACSVHSLLMQALMCCLHYNKDYLLSWPVPFLPVEHCERRAGPALNDERVIHALSSARGASFCLPAVAAAV
jgi:hypothetical protein